MTRHLVFLLAMLTYAGSMPAQEPAPAAPAPAPTPPAERLRALLRELQQLGSEAWTARLAALEQEAKEHEAQSSKHREEAQRLEQQAAAADGKAKALRAEMERIQKLQQMVQQLAPAAPAAPAAAPPATGTAPAGGPAAGQPAKEATPAAPLPGPAPAAAPASAAAAAAAAEAFVVWADVEPIFSDHCSSCHDPDANKGGLDLTSFAAAMQGGGSGRSIVAGEPDQSRLYRLVTQQERPFMPRDSEPLPAALKAKLRQWIEHGAAEDQDGARTFQAERSEAAKAAAASALAFAGPPPMPTDWPAVPLRLPARAVPIRALQRSPRIGLLALPGLGQTLLLGSDLTPLGTLPSALPTVTTVAFSTDGALLAVGGGEAGRSGQVVVHDLRSGRELGTAGHERDLPLAIAVHHGADGAVLVALGGAGRCARVHALADGRELLAGRHDDFVLGLSFAPDGSVLAAGDRSGAIVLWELDGGRAGALLRGHQGAVHALAFARDGRSLLSAGKDGTLRMWDVAEAKERWRQNAHRGEALAVAFGPGTAVASCGSDGRIAVCTTAGRPVVTSDPVGEWLYGVAFGDDDGVVFAGDAQGRLHRLSGNDKQTTATTPLPPHQ